MKNKNEIKTFELQPFNNRKSFYWKCICIEDWDIISLKSYNTIVATYSKFNKCLNINWWYSKTTKSHIDSFIKYLWFDSVSKKQIENWYIINWIN